MTKEEYKELLNRPEWKKKRNSILKRDNYTCQNPPCKSKESLHVHHKHYIQGKMPWEVPDSCLITLCETCHFKEHKDKDISEFILKPKRQNQKKIFTKKKKDRKGEKIKKLLRDCLTKEEKASLRTKGIEIGIGLLQSSEFFALRTRVKIAMKGMHNVDFTNIRNILSQPIYM